MALADRQFFDFPTMYDQLFNDPPMLMEGSTSRSVSSLQQWQQWQHCNCQQRADKLLPQLNKIQSQVKY